MIAFNGADGDEPGDGVIKFDVYTDEAGEGIIKFVVAYLDEEAGDGAINWDAYRDDEAGDVIKFVFGVACTLLLTIPR